LNGKSGMRMRRKKTERAVACSLLVLGAALAVSAQRPGASGGANPSARLLHPSSAPVAAVARGEVIREIDDPHTGARWLLVRNEEHPGGPGRLVLVGGQGNESGGASRQTEAEEARLRPVIRTGDRLVVEEHTARVDAALEARALGPAASGGGFNARLAIGGRVVRAVALGPGRAAFLPETEAR